MYMSTSKNSTTINSDVSSEHVYKKETCVNEIFIPTDTIIAWLFIGVKISYLPPQEIGIDMWGVGIQEFARAMAHDYDKNKGCKS